MTPKMARVIVEACNELPFVNWDRFIDCGSTVVIFGWIDRKQDSYKDFVSVEINSRGQVEFTTSSAEYSQSISEIYAAYGRLPSGAHLPCQRIEDQELLTGVRKVVKIRNKEDIKE
jgi:hypothetical protein